MSKEFTADTLNGTIREQYVSNISMIVTLVSFTMLFATMFLGYALYRLTSETWPPMGMESVSLGLPILSTVIIALSSIAFWMYEKSYARNEAQSSWLWATSVFGGLFLVSQLMLWSSLKSTGLYASSGIFGSIIYAFTWVHSAHILMGLGALAWLGLRIKRKKAILMTVRNVGKFWHFLGIVWLIMFITIFAI